MAIGLGLGPRVFAPRVLGAGVVASILPDVDVVAFRFGIAYTDAFGHRGATHSLTFALMLGVVALALARHLHATRGTTFFFVAASAASHGLLDMFTNGGRGIALWWPFSDERLFFPWQVIEVSPLSLRGLAGERGVRVLQSELLWVWMPAVVLCLALALWRRHRSN